MMFLQNVLAPFVLFCVFAMLGYAIRSHRVAYLIKVRRQALLDAREALLSLADVADKAAKGESDSFDAAKARNRAYYYGRAALVVGSIPVDRV